MYPISGAAPYDDSHKPGDDEDGAPKSAVTLEDFLRLPA